MLRPSASERIGVGCAAAAASAAIGAGSCGRRRSADAQKDSQLAGVSLSLGHQRGLVRLSLFNRAGLVAALMPHRADGAGLGHAHLPGSCLVVRRRRCVLAAVVVLRQRLEAVKAAARGRQAPAALVQEMGKVGGRGAVAAAVTREQPGLACRQEEGG